MPTKYLKILIPMEGGEIELLTAAGALIAKKYERVVVGGRGPYIEIKPIDIVEDNIYIPDSEAWRSHSDVAYYVEYRSKDIDNIMIYYQLREVAYADYKEKMFYISPFDVVSKEYPQLAQWRV